MLLNIGGRCAFYSHCVVVCAPGELNARKMTDSIDHRAKDGKCCGRSAYGWPGYSYRWNKGDIDYFIMKQK